MGKIVFVVLLLIHFLLVSKKAVYCRDQRKLIAHLSPYLEPPPISRNIKAYPLLHKHPPQFKHAHAHYAPPINNHYTADSMLPKLTNWLWPTKKERDKAASTISSKSILQTRSHDFAIEDKKCNPCNSVPWIPILGVNPHALKQLEPVTFHPPPAYSADSLYSSFNDMASNLNPVNVIPSAFPLYFGNAESPELTHNHIQDNKFESAAFPATSWNAGSFSSSGTDNLQEPSLHNAQTGASNHFVQNISLNNWPYEPKAMPLSHHLWSVDYPLQIYQTPLVDVPSYQLPEPGIDLPSHVQNQVFQSTVPPRHEALVHHFTSTAEGSHDQYNALGHNSIDDNKYSPSENKFTSVAAESNHLNDSYPSTSTDFSDNITESLIDFLTPPTASTIDWLFETETEPPKKKKQIQIVIPYTVNKNHVQTNDSDKWSTEKPFSQKLKDIWSSFTETTPLPIVSYLKGNNSVIISKVTVPNKRQELSDMLRLQKAIDTWTVEGYSNHKHKPNDYYFQKVITSTLNPSKEIPQNYLASTVSYVYKEPIRIRVKYNQSPKMEEKMHKNSYEGGAVYKNNSSKPWEKLPVSVSPLTKEKVYIVTPLPLTSYNFSADGVIENWP